jgi:hypothetical protein
MINQEIVLKQPLRSPSSGNALVDEGCEHFQISHSESSSGRER